MKRLNLEFIEERRIAAGIPSRRELARRVGVDPTLVNKWFSNAKRGVYTDPGTSTIHALANVLQCDISSLLTGKDDARQDTTGSTRRLTGLTSVQEPVGIPLVGIVEAGAFRTVTYFDDLPVTNIPAARDNRFPHARHLAYKVSGDSMNLAGIHDGDIIIAVDWIESGWHLRDGDFVVVERSLDGGHTIELTVKEAHVFADHVELRPNSSNARHQPIRITLGDLDNGTTVRIRALVLYSQRPLLRGR